MAAKHRPGRKKRPSKMKYNATQRWIANKLRKVARHCKKFPADAQAAKVLEQLS